jgi:molybdopterin-containing oxidoreductase family iron-sulfur binding subunit
MAHYLESWSDTRTNDGTVTIVQPLIAPLYDGKTAHEMLALFSDNYDKKPYDIVKEYWRTTGAKGQGSGAGTASNRTANGSERAKAQLRLRRFAGAKRRRDACDPPAGCGAPTTGAPTRRSSANKRNGALRLRIDLAQVAARRLYPKHGVADEDNDAEVGLGFFITKCEHDTRAPSQHLRGRLPSRPINLRRPFANNGWLQELPKPLTKITWDNVALVSPTRRRRSVVCRRTTRKRRSVKRRTSTWRRWAWRQVDREVSSGVDPAGTA